jgi:PAS domain S-box-containing protein
VRHPRLRSLGSLRAAVPALIVVLSVAGYLVTHAAVRHDRESAAARHAEVETVRTRGALGRARAYVAGLGSALAGEPRPQARRFAQLQGGAAGSIGLTDALWVERVPASGRAAYERRIGAPIARRTPSGRSVPAPRAASYLPATFLTGTAGPQLRPGTDVSSWPALSAALRDPSSVFAIAASRPGALGDRPGFYLLEAGRFGRGPGSRGFLVVFVPRGWLTVTLQDDPRRVAISLAGRRLEGRLDAAPAAGRSFAALAQPWRVDVGNDPSAALQSTLPWLALAWPIAAAALVYLLGRGVLRRRRAERQFERIFDLSVDLLCVATFDGYFTRVNPAVERTLGYSGQELVSRPFADFVHEDDRASTREALDRLAGGQEIVQFENRYVRADGSICWLQWSVRPETREGLVYAAARDVTESRRAAEELRQAQQAVESSRDELRVLADEQVALRRVATLVARGGSPHEVFDAVAMEMGQLLAASSTRLLRYEPDATATVVASHGQSSAEIPAGSRLPLDGTSLLDDVRRTGRAARADRLEEASSGPLTARVRALGITTAVGAPIAVEGRLWGVMVCGWGEAEPVSPDAEGRMAQFTELVATAVANAEGRAELTASRARVVAASDETRRRIERDLHDGTQQRLVSLALALRSTEAAVPPEQEALRRELSRSAEGLAAVVDDLREISRGIHPAILSKGGLGAAVKSLARRSPVPVELDVQVGARLPEPVEVAAYYVVSEALTNAAKHARASAVSVAVGAADSVVTLAIRDDGVGGADPTRGSGLVGLRDRVEALGGTIEIASGSGDGTAVVARIPVRPGPERSG